jgi:hypothetical protein
MPFNTLTMNKQQEMLSTSHCNVAWKVKIEKQEDVVLTENIEQNTIKSHICKKIFLRLSVFS